MPVYNAVETEKKWQKKWAESGIYKTDLESNEKPKYYNLVMFPYPSGDKLHIGHWYNFAPADSWGRFMRMKGYNVFEPQGYDSFGLPAENYAIKKGVHPTISIKENIEYMRKQLTEMGAMYDFSREVVTSTPEYYQWTQWIFLQLYKKGLAYRKKAPVNWCPSCQTVLANEQVVDGFCERCKHEVTKKDLTQWFFKIRNYAERLLKYDGLDWPEKTKLMQQHWIGKSTGSEIWFDLVDEDGGAIMVEAAGSDSGGGGQRGASDSNGGDSDWRRAGGSNGGAAAHGSNGGAAAHGSNGGAAAGGSNGGAAAHGPRMVPAKIKVFTTRIDTLFGATYVVLAPEHPLATIITTKKRMQNVEEYIDKTRKETDINRTSTERVKTGAETGAFARNPVNGKIVPVWIADYVLVTYGTGAVMAVPAHDERDYAFAKKYELPILPVIAPDPAECRAGAAEVHKATKAGEPGAGGASDTVAPAAAVKTDHRSAPAVMDSLRKNLHKLVELEAFTDDGILIDSGDFDGLSSETARVKITEALKEKGAADFNINYKLRDWLVSRQRYWGAPIPIVYCEKCGEKAVPEDQLPVELPRDVDFTPKGDGRSPLNTVHSFVNTKCPECGGKATREVDTMDTFVDSSWYFLRYPSANLAEKPFDPALTKKWLPVDMYIGGPEHACMHLLYARFINMVLHDLGHIDFEEPFKRLIHQGMITKDGAKMSKSKGNVVSPDGSVEKYGSDVFRMYLMFMGPFSDGGDWNDQGITGIARFVERFYVLAHSKDIVADKEEMNRMLHKTIKKVTEEIEKFHFNTTIAALMEFVNFGYKNGLDQNARRVLILLAAPLAPHLAEELWEKLGGEFTVFDQDWPKYDECMMADSCLNLPVQVNGKLRAQITVPADSSKESIIELARANENVIRHLEGKKLLKEIYVPGRMVSFVVE